MKKPPKKSKKSSVKASSSGLFSMQENPESSKKRPSESELRPTPKRTETKRNTNKRGYDAEEAKVKALSPVE